MSIYRIPLFVLSISLPLATAALAAPGQIEINQASALAGGVTTGDAPGFPVSLNEPGNYLLTSDLVVPNENTTAIELGSAADRTSIDLGGFRIAGVTFCSPIGICGPRGSGIGVAASSGTIGVALRNGMITGMGSHGVRLQNQDYVKAVLAISNGGNGIEVGPRSSVIECQAIHNGGAGIRIDENPFGSLANAGESLLQGNLATQNAIVDSAALDIEGSRATGGNICGDGNCSPRGIRRFYLTDQTHNGATASGACTGGYHMASMWEILDPSNLEYAEIPQRGVTTFPHRPDQGSGPPSGLGGWVRTGRNSDTSITAGRGNCNAFTTTSGNGSTANLRTFWDDGETTEFGAWVVTGAACSNTIAVRVWCVED